MKTIFSWRMFLPRAPIRESPDRRLKPARPTSRGSAPKAGSSPISTPTISKWTHPEDSPLAIAAEVQALSALERYGSVEPDIVRAVRRVSCVSGRCG